MGVAGSPPAERAGGRHRQVQAHLIQKRRDLRVEIQDLDVLRAQLAKNTGCVGAGNQEKEPLCKSWKTRELLILRELVAAHVPSNLEAPGLDGSERLRKWHELGEIQESIANKKQRVATHTQTNQDSGPNANASFICAVHSLVLQGHEGSLIMSVDLQSRIRGSLLRVVSYNPMSLIQGRRAVDISEELSADLIGLQGTRSRFVPRPGIVDRYTVRRHTRHWELSWGWQNTRHSNRSAGCSIYVKTKRWRERDLCQVYSTPAVLQGRVGVARLRTGRSDVAMLVAYFPPKPSQQKEWKAYQHTCEAICDWLIETLSLVPTRCTPFVATDLNTQLGIEAGRHEPRWIPEVGTRGATLEDETATMFRNVLKQHRLIAINTHTLMTGTLSTTHLAVGGRALISCVCLKSFSRRFPMQEYAWEQGAGCNW